MLSSLRQCAVASVDATGLDALLEGAAVERVANVDTIIIDLCG